MGYYLIADLTAHKYEVYHIREKQGVYSEDFYHQFREFMVDVTGNDVRGDVQTNAMDNNTFINSEEKDFVYFEKYLQDFKLNYYKQAKPQRH